MGAAEADTAQRAPVPALNVDPFSPAFFDDPFPTHALLRLARRVVRLEPAGIPVRKHNNTLRGLSSLPVRLVA